MPMYEYLCKGCDHRFEIMQALSAKADETVCPRCNTTNCRRLMSSFASKITGTQKPGFSEMKAYDMLGERLNKFSKLPPAMGKRAAPTPSNSEPSAAGGGEGET